MIAKVFHAKRSDFFTAAQAYTEDAFVHVADVEVGDLELSAALEKAYFLTNSIDSHWSENVGVQAIGELTRSTSVGDIVELAGKKHAVARMGFTEL